VFGGRTHFDAPRCVGKTRQPKHDAVRIHEGVKGISGDVDPVFFSRNDVSATATNEHTLVALARALLLVGGTLCVEWHPVAPNPLARGRIVVAQMRPG
jgi:hypothetical protein